MHKEDFDTVLKARPFRPFELRLVDGRRLRFRSPEQVIVGRSVLVTMDKKGHPVLINLMLIVSLHVLNGNGRAKK